MVDSLRIFRMIAVEFVEMPDDEILDWLALARPNSGRVMFGANMQEANANLAAHLIFMKNKAYDQSQGMQEVASISEDGASMTFIKKAPNPSDPFADLKSSPYGLRYLALRQPGIRV